MPTRLSGSAPESDTHWSAAARRRTSRIQAAEDAQEVAPGRQPLSLPRQQSPEHDAISTQKGARHVLDGAKLGLIAAALRLRAADDRPATAALDGEGQHAPAPPDVSTRFALAGRCEQSPQSAEAVRGYKAEPNEFGQRRLE